MTTPDEQATADPVTATDPVAGEIAAGYDFPGPALEFGSVVHGGVPHPTAQVRVPLSMMNRHGLIAGATGTGKTKTLQLLAEQLSAQGVPVVLADVKGDLSGLARPGESGDRVTRRAADTADDWTPTGFPVEYLALGGLGTGVPLRATVTSFGPLLLSKVMDLNATQTSSLGLVFHHADSAGLPLLDLKDLRAVISWLTSNAGKPDLEQLGGLSRATAGVILRELVTLEDGGGDVFFGEPEWETSDLLRTTPDGRGVITAVELSELQDRPRLFSTFLMWLLADLFEELPEVGDTDRPKLVFFFDEAHLLFTGASKAFLETVTQTVRLIRSKGVGIFFVTQNPTDVPTPVLGQLGNRVQHALRSFTPEDADALKKTVRTYPKTDAYDIAETLGALGTGEAVITVLSERGAPTPVAWTMLRAPRSAMAPLDPAAQQQAVAASPLQARYGTPLDRDSAYERLAARMAPPEPAPVPRRAPAPERERADDPAPRARRRTQPEPADDGVLGQVLKSSAFRSFARSAASALGREVTRGIFGTRRRR
ncbi:helicase HerA-like domain-containing protein [Modestobacter altitudinis]|uniref:helicase HerA-like domain-containing protein n=1 Tax=Modestobacter altitudinis TaxID=2213158 RepID=UPI00110CDC84|nr:helicase HerA-like domain-containing protein [Modestobacter altitudinis]